MAEYIERETFLKDIEERYCLPCKEAGRDHNGCKCDVCWVDDMCGDVIDAPSADVAPVVHGLWVRVPNKLARVCSACNRDEPYKFAYIDAYVYDYCPKCGARMDGDDDAKAD